MKAILTAAVLAMSIGAATASEQFNMFDPNQKVVDTRTGPVVVSTTSDDWTFEQWADYCGDAWLDGTEKTEAERHAEGTDHTQGASIEAQYHDAMTYHDRAAENLRVYIERMRSKEMSDYVDSNLLYGVEEF